MAETVNAESVIEMDLSKVLVVDDNVDGRTLLKRILDHTGFHVILAGSGEEAIEKARAELPFLIITDIMMPEMDGFELCQRLKADERTKDAALIFITAYPGDGERIGQGLDLGAVDYIARPFDNRELVARVQAVARAKRAELEARQRAIIVARRNTELEFLNDLALAASYFPGFHEALNSSMPRLCRLLGAQAVALFLLEQPHELTVNVVSQDGRSVSAASAIRSDGLTPAMLYEQIPPTLTGILSDPQNSLGIGPPDASQIHSVPLTIRAAQERAVGALAVILKQGASLTPADQMLLNSAAGIVTVAMENGRLFAEVQEFNRHLEQMVEDRTRRLIEEEKKTATILASMADGLLVLDAEGRIAAANKVAEEMLGFHLDEMQGQPILAEQLRSPLWRLVNDMAVSSELTLSHTVDLPDTAKPGTVLSIAAHSAKMWGEDGQPSGTVILLRDITALREVERMKVRFMAGVTHELKTPLAVIRVHADNLLAYGKRLPERKKEEILETIQKQVVLLEQLVEDILDLTRLDTGAVHLDRRPVDLGMLADEVLAGMRTLAEAKRLVLRWEKPATANVILADDKLIRRVIRNLVDNAIKYTPEGGLIEVKVIPEAGEDKRNVCIQVRDTGIGIEPVHQNRIFERFYRVDSSHTIPGTGLGLAIVREIVEAHNGKMWLESTPGKGSTFTVMLPGAE